MNEKDYWRFTPLYTISEAAALIVDSSPNLVSQGTHNNPDEITLDGINYNKFSTVLQAIIRSVKNGDIKCKLVDQLVNELNKRCLPDYEADLQDIDIPAYHVNNYPLLAFNEIKDWLSSKGMSTGFFFPTENTELPSYLNKDHPCFAPKLYAAIKAWEAISQEDDNYHTPKQNIERWLKNRAAEFGLEHKSDTDQYKKGDVKTSALREISAVANWKQDGGRTANQPE